jgi:hypothetical protein
MSFSPPSHPIMHACLFSLLALAPGIAFAAPQQGTPSSSASAPDPSQVAGQIEQPQCLAAIGNIFSNSSYPTLSQCLGDQQLGQISKWRKREKKEKVKIILIFFSCSFRSVSIAKSNTSASLVPGVQPYLNETCPQTCDSNALNQAFSDTANTCGTAQEISPQVGTQAYTVIKAGACATNRCVAQEKRGRSQL